MIDYNNVGNQIDRANMEWAKPGQGDWATLGHDIDSVRTLVSSGTFKDFTIGFMSGDTQKMQESLMKMAELATERRTNFTNKGSAMGFTDGAEGRISQHKDFEQKFKSMVLNSGGDKQQMVETLKKVLTYMFPLGVPGSIGNVMKAAGMTS